MTVLSFPSTYDPATVSWRLRAPTQMHESPFDGSAQTLRLPAERWVATLSWPTIKQSDWRLLSAFLAQLGGRAGRFYYGPVHAPRLASGSGSPVVNGSAQTGTTLSTRGWSAGAQAFKAGDFLSYTDTNSRSRLHMAVADAVANGSGVAAVTIAPPIRVAGNDGATIVIGSPVGVFRMQQDEGGLEVRPGPFGSLTLDIEEALV